MTNGSLEEQRASGGGGPSRTSSSPSQRRRALLITHNFKVQRGERKVIALDNGEPASGGWI